jgi:hypothetical protein
MARAIQSVRGAVATVEGRAHRTTRKKRKGATHTAMGTLQVREPVTRNGQANESRASTAIHSVGAWQHADRPARHGMTAPFTAPTPLSPLAITSWTVHTQQPHANSADRNWNRNNSDSELLRFQHPSLFKFDYKPNRNKQTRLAGLSWCMLVYAGVHQGGIDSR